MICITKFHTINDILNKITPLQLSVGPYFAQRELRNLERIDLKKYLSAWKHYFNLLAKVGKDNVYIERDILEADKIRVYADSTVLDRLGLSR
ncbi:MAG: hypothetical protein QW063_01860 [Candidatus Nanoarchaeia archaeon]